MSSFEAIVSYLDTFGTFGVIAVLGLGFYLRKIRLGSECERVELEAQELRAEVKTLWQEKAEDAKETQDLARAYLRLREGEK